MQNGVKLHTDQSKSHLLANCVLWKRFGLSQGNKRWEFNKFKCKVYKATKQKKEELVTPHK